MRTDPRTDPAASAVRPDRMRWWHLPAVAAIERDLFGAEEWSKAMFWSELAQRDTRYYVILPAVPDAGRSPMPGEDAGRGEARPDGDGGGSASGDPDVLGYAGLCVYGPDDAWVQTLAVRRDRQGRGHGALLLDDLLAEAARRGARRVSLEVRADNAHAQRLYARRGFEAVGLRKGYYQPSNTDAVVMVREGDGR